MSFRNKYKLLNASESEYISENSFLYSTQELILREELGEKTHFTKPTEQMLRLQCADALLNRSTRGISLEIFQSLRKKTSPETYLCLDTGWLVPAQLARQKTCHDAALYICTNYVDVYEIIKQEYLQVRQEIVDTIVGMVMSAKKGQKPYFSLDTMEGTSSYHAGKKAFRDSVSWPG